MAREEKIVMHNGKMIVMDNCIIMGPCREFEFKVNGMALKDFYQKTIDESQTITVAGVAWQCMPLGCTLSVGSGGVLSGSGAVVDAWGDEYGSWSGEVTSGPGVVQGVKKGTFMLYDVTPGSVERLDFRYRTIRPKKDHTYILEFGAVIYSTITTITNLKNQPSKMSTNEDCYDYGTWIEFTVEKQDGKPTIGEQRFLSAPEMYEKYNEILAFLPNKYIVGSPTPAGIRPTGTGPFYVNGPIEFDAIVSIGPVEQEGVIP